MRVVAISQYLGLFTKPKFVGRYPPTGVSITLTDETYITEGLNNSRFSVQLAVTRNAAVIFRNRRLSYGSPNSVSMLLWQAANTQNMSGLALWSSEASLSKLLQGSHFRALPSKTIIDEGF